MTSPLLWAILDDIAMQFAGDKASGYGVFKPVLDQSAGYRED
jgi:hypothetical protein